MTRMALGVVCVLAACVSAPAVQPAVWSHGTEADFAAGKLDKTVLTSLGEVTLAREVETLLAPDAKLGMISAVAVDGKDVYVASAPGGKIYRVAKGKAVEFAELPATLVRPLIADKDGLLAGVSGKKAGLYRVDAKGEVAPLWTDEAVTFVWAVVPDGDGGWYVATGSEGKVYHVRRGAGEVIYDSDDENVLSLVADADGLYAGTGENGLVVRIDPARKTSRIAYDAPEKEISCLLAAPDGSVYAATSDSSRSSATGEKPSAKDGGAPTTPAPAKGAPKPPAAKTAATAPAAGPKAPGRVLIITRKPAPRPASGPTPPRPTASGGGKGNAVYHIDAEGFVRTVFRRPVSLWAMALSGDGLILATGHGGELFRVDPAADRTSMIAKLDPKDITAMAADADGRLILGAADTAARTSPPWPPTPMAGSSWAPPTPPGSTPSRPARPAPARSSPPPWTPSRSPDGAPSTSGRTSQPGAPPPSPRAAATSPSPTRRPGRTGPGSCRSARAGGRSPPSRGGSSSTA